VVRILIQAALALALVGTGWVAAKAQLQKSPPDFELQIDAPTGYTAIKCTRGCRLASVQRGVDPNFSPQPSIAFECGDGSRCGSNLLVGGWVVP